MKKVNMTQEAEIALASMMFTTMLEVLKTASTEIPPSALLAVAGMRMLFASEALDAEGLFQRMQTFVRDEAKPIGDAKLKEAFNHIYLSGLDNSGITFHTVQ